MLLCWYEAPLMMLLGASLPPTVLKLNSILALGICVTIIYFFCRICRDFSQLSVVFLILALASGSLRITTC